ncbi:hypothetical protein BIW11_05001, partial [Tropilaelaps mercedesae]
MHKSTMISALNREVNFRYDFSIPLLYRAPLRQPTLQPASRLRFLPSSRFSSREVARTVEAAKDILNERLVREEEIFVGTSQTDRKVNLYAQNGSDFSLNPEWTFWLAAQGDALATKLRNISVTAILVEEATRLLVKNNALNGQAVAYELPLVDTRETELDHECPRPFEHPCPPHKYRSFSGHCNNVQNPNWGSSGSRYGRFLPPEYADNISEPRMQSSTGSPLPSARSVSLLIHSDANRPHPHVNVMFVALAEFIALDLANTVPYMGPHYEPLNCCGVPLGLFHPECFPIRVPFKDPTHEHRACLQYIRSAPAVRSGCTFGPREQINQATSFIDASPLYGNSEEEAASLRLFRGGELRTEKRLDKTESAPRMAPGSPKICHGEFCFLAGDIRINENAALSSMHTLWLREHNRVARALASLNPHWGDYVLFEETRRIIIAEMQHIVYAEMLPTIIGSELMERYKLRPLSSGYFENYNINLDPSTTNEAASVVLNFVISMMPGHLEYLDLHNSTRRNRVEISKTFYASNEVRSHTNEFVLGMLAQHAQAGDEYISVEMTKTQTINTTLHQPSPDTVSAIIQRGRDHGVPGYTAFRRFCGLTPPLQRFEDMATIITPETVKKLAFLYQTVDDVDLFVGGLAETPLEGAVIGPTFACLLALQFQISKYGDRFYYENDLPPSKLSKEQLAQIRRTSLARLICDNSEADKESMMELQPASLLVPDPFLNAEEKCSSPGLGLVDLSAWKSWSSVEVTDKLGSDNLRAQLTRARRQLDDFRQTEIRLQRRQGSPDQTSSQAVLSALLRPNEDALRMANDSLLLELASREIILSSFRTIVFDRDSEHAIGNMQDLLAILPTVELPEDMRPARIPGHCDDVALPCDHTTKFRTMTGWCNNLRKPSFGKSLTPFNRIAPPRYADGVSEMVTVGSTGQPLPSPRAISTAMHYDIADAHRRYTLMVMQWGQFLDHDVTLTPVVEYPDKSNINCKSCDSTITVHPECRPIPVPAGDQHFSTHLPDGSDNCISFVRSLPGQQSLGARQQ